MDGTSAGRDLPVLDAVVCQLDAGAVAGMQPDGADIAASTGLGIEEAGAALQAPKDGFLDLERPIGGPAGGS
jgi:hypothetical protein